MAAKTPSKSFPCVLHQLLKDSGSSGDESIVSWLPHGKAFRVHDTKAFVSDILPRYFAQSKITSFQRQLNLYCFSRIKYGKEKGSYFHPYFLRDEPQLSERIIRMPLKGSKSKICDKNADKTFNTNLEGFYEQGRKKSAERNISPKIDSFVTSDFCRYSISNKQQGGYCQHPVAKNSVVNPSLANACSHDDDLLSFCTSDW